MTEHKHDHTIGLSTADLSIRLYLLSALFAVGTGVAFSFDLRVTALVNVENAPGDLQKALQLSEAFAHGFGVFAILLAIYVLDETKRDRFVQLLFCVISSGVFAQIAKQLIARNRPLTYGETGLPDSIWQTFGGWFPAFAQDSTGLRATILQSFPSGHTAQAVGLAIGLAWLYPKGWWLFAILAGLAAFQRIECQAHFLSDTLAGAAVACVVSALVLDRRAFGRFLPASGET